MPDENVRVEMRDQFPQVDLRAEHEKFTDYWRSKSGQGATKLDWNATWRNWIRRAADSLPTHRSTKAEGNLAILDRAVQRHQEPE